MISIAEYIKPECIALELKEKKKKQVIQELTELLRSTGHIDNAPQLVTLILKRERMASTGIGHGVAIPHVLSEYTDRTLITVGRSQSGVAFDAVDNLPVQLIFLILGPPSSASDHLKLLSKLSRLLSDQQFRQNLLEAETAEEVIELFRSKEEL